MQPTLYQCPLSTKRCISTLSENKDLPCLGKMTKNKQYSDFFPFFGILVGLAKQEGSGKDLWQKSDVGLCVTGKNGKRD